MLIKAKIWEIGSTAVITIPKTYIDAGNVKIGDEILIEVKQIWQTPIQNKKE